MQSRSQWTTGPQGQHAELGTIEHNGKEYSSGGAYISPSHLVCYPNDKGEVCDWAGNVIGTYRILSSRPIRSWQGSRYFYMRARVAGRTYSISGFGSGMIARGKALKACR